MSKVLVTGAAGFIGFHTACRLLERGETVVGYDIVNDYYDPTLKYARLAELGKFENFTFIRGDISNKAAMEQVWAEYGPFKRVVHLAAQAGVRYSLENPYSYITSNCMGHITVLEMCRHTEGFEHLVYASSSSVYGGNTELPYSIQHDVNRPISLYAATKRSDELMSYCYSHLFGLKQTGLRFFTVYGPWGRPDMALFIFTKAIAEGNKLPVFNDGLMKRDFTFIDDIVTGILACLDNPPEPGTCEPPARVFNIGNTRSENLMDFIAIIEQEMGRKADIEYLPMQLGDVEATYADVTETTEAVGYRPTTSINEGIPKFVSWFKKYHNIN
ncbi:MULTISPECIES: NAD-dependent epimerase/dehydratase family protein [Rhizobium]|uniref:NAD-dependent epimerase/dehydratase family protein n=1 Tax=Rhizobium TaxID=379 RepID=UPI001C922FAB|nr:MULTISPECIES: NAD-dependent epimerase/dehydratase family protein [Rhizobium]MBY3266792.1 NAD-dependent epimerase/dehydratase family protein [Rhizobium laguerreae]MBY3328812.1 NAD-dependent epimerase/dehydratase family protein [Rhizobium laguerreae]MBY3342012.1 NAD-dependent epimerase/dehydratase family protein [Rhizobium laguerreae]MBY3397580.1 NAD-dependent epimerase/dehydratase family protein [Rhizobium laguerreae]MBY5664632.1 NAD-dependent epimerase/dehydratase family protein [Rhizobium 